MGLGGLQTLAPLLLLRMVLSEETIREKLVTRNEREIFADGVARNSIDVRWMALRASWQAFVDHPISGVGYSRSEGYSTRDPEINAATLGQGIVTHNTHTGKSSRKEVFWSVCGLSLACMNVLRAEGETALRRRDDEKGLLAQGVAWASGSERVTP